MNSMFINNLIILPAHLTIATNTVTISIKNRTIFIIDLCATFSGLIISQTPNLSHQIFYIRQLIYMQIVFIVPD